MHTEDEAKKLWCPQARVIGTLHQPASPGDPDYVVGQGSQNRGFSMGGPLTNCNCIASKCMAWRWAKIINPDHQPPRDMWPDGREPHEKELYIDGREKGYCGLAGKP